MNKRLEFNIKNIMIVALIICLLSSVSSYISTSYAITENEYAIKSENVEYKDNSNLGVTQVQAAIDGTCTKIDTRLDAIESNVITLDKVYPVGSIYISTTLSDKTQVANTLGGTWEPYGEGKTLIGVDTSQTSYSNVGNTGGSTTAKLSVSNIPNHVHTTGTATITSSGSHTHTTTKTTTSTMSLTAQEGGKHSHKIKIESSTLASGSKYARTASTSSTYTENAGTNEAGAHTHSVTGSVTIPALSITSSGAHTHTVPTLTTNTCTNCSGSTFSVQNPYITVYMYRRTA